MKTINKESNVISWSFFQNFKLKILTIPQLSWMFIRKWHLPLPSFLHHYEIGSTINCIYLLFWYFTPSPSFLFRGLFCLIRYTYVTWQPFPPQLNYPRGLRMLLVYVVWMIACWNPSIVFYGTFIIFTALRKTFRNR